MINKHGAKHINLKDADIRKTLRHHLAQVYPPSSLFINELKIAYGAARADMIVVDENLHGFEIKSDADTLIRLSNQVINYSKVCTQATIVCTEKWQNIIPKYIPDWWGIMVAAPGPESMLNLHHIRKPIVNCQLDAYALCQFLQKNVLKNMLSSPRSYLPTSETVI